LAAPAPSARRRPARATRAGPLARRAARPASFGPRRAPRAPRPSGGGADLARVRGEQEWHVGVLVRVGDRDADLDLLEEATGGAEDDPVDARLERRRRELGDPAVLVGLLLRDQLVATVEADLQACSGPSVLGVENVRRDHGLNFSA